MMHFIASRQKGFTLIELMVALILGLFLTGGILEFFVSNSQIYRVQDARARLQENGRYLTQILTDNIKRTGYTGCSTNQTTPDNTLDSSKFLLDFNKPIQAFDAPDANSPPPIPSVDGTPGGPKAVIDPLPGSDVLTLRNTIKPVVSIVNNTNNGIYVHPNSGLNAGDTVLVTDCSNAAAIFQIASTNNNKITPTSGSFNYDNGELLKMVTTSFYVKNNEDDIPVPSLYQRVDDADAQELVAGVENMQLQFGIDTNGNGSVDSYVNAQGISTSEDSTDGIDPKKVVSVRISLLLVSIADNLTVNGPQAYQFNGITTIPDDNKLRLVFTRTITLDNRAL